jgi:hypothetical protein
MVNGFVDLHVHAAPSVLPRRYTDTELVAIAQRAGAAAVVLKAHEGSTAERARLAGAVAVGGIVLNSPVGGANVDAVRVAAALGARVMWMPTASAPAHQAAHHDPALSVHRNEFFSPVPICDGARLRREWYPVLAAVAELDLVLASGHLTVDEAVCVFQAAAELGARRFVVNHPLFAFQGWREEHAEILRRLAARIEVGVLADHLAGAGPTPTNYFATRYPLPLLVFGSDLGHTSFPAYEAGVRDWARQQEPRLGHAALEQILATNGQELLKR